LDTLRLVFVTERNVERVVVLEAEAGPPLIIDRDGVLPDAVVFERAQSIAGRNTKVADLRHLVNGLESAQGTARDVRWDTLRLSRAKELLRPAVGEGLDHSEL
jgi:hypothetical protein